MGEMGDLNPPPALTQDSRMLILPYEILLLVAESLPLRSWNALARTCRHLYNVFMPSLYSIAVSTKNGEGDVFEWAARKGRLDTIHRIMNYAPKGYFNCVYGEAALREAARTGQTEIIRWLLDSGVDPNCTQTRSGDFETDDSIYGAPPLLIAAERGHTEAAKLLLDNMTDFNYVRSLEESPVIGFVRGKQTALLESILQRGIDVDQRDRDGQTALFYAVMERHISGVMLLLEFGADINATDAHQVTPLYLASEMGQEAVVELLLQRGARADIMAHGGQTSLHAATSANSIKAVSLLIKHGANVNSINRWLESALHLSLSDRIEAGILKLLLDAGADFTVPNKDGDTPLKCACMWRAKEKVRLLLDAIQAREASSNLRESSTTLLNAAIFAQHDLAYRLLAQGADVNTRINGLGWTPLIQVAHQGRDGLFDLALKKSLDVNAKDCWGRTALSFATEHGSEHKVRSLLKRNADYRLPCYRTPLTYAARNHHLQVVLLLLRHTEGVDLADDSLRSAVTSAVAFGDAEFLELIHEKGKIDRLYPYGETALQRAASMGNLPVVKWLLNQSAGIDAVGNDRRTPLMLAVYRRNAAVVKQLLEHGPRLDARDDNHETVLHLAFREETKGKYASEPPHGTGPSRETLNSDHILKGDVECGHTVLSNIVKMLVEAGADLEAKNAMDETPLHCAAINGSGSAVRLLLEKGVNVEPRDKSALVPLLLAASKGHTAVVCLLLEYSASIDSTNADGDTALMIAAHNGHHETILSLLARSAGINRVNHAHRTALSQAAEKGHYKVVEILLQYGAEVDLPDHTGQTPLVWAIQKGNERCVELLVQGCADVTRGDIKGRTPLWWASRDETNSQKSRDALIRILYDRHPASS